MLWFKKRNVLLVYSNTLTDNWHFCEWQPAYYNLGVVYSEMNEYDTALGYYEKAAVHRPMYAEAYCNMGVIYKNRGDLEAAIACYERWVHWLDSFCSCTDYTQPDFFVTISNGVIYFLDRQAFDACVASDVNVNILTIWGYYNFYKSP